jgi:hypothetical protein
MATSKKKAKAHVAFKDLKSKANPKGGTQMKWGPKVDFLDPQSLPP